MSGRAASPFAAELGRIRLKEEGIESTIADQASATSGYGAIAGGIRLQVEDADAKRAAEILSESAPQGLPMTLTWERLRAGRIRR
jgi:hypothetical protein